MTMKERISGSSTKKKKELREAALRTEVAYTAQSQTPEQVRASFCNVDLKKGLSDADVANQFKQYGPNKLTPPKTTPGWVKFLRQFTHNFFSVLLMVGGILCFIGYGLDQSDPTNMYLGIVLVLVVVITATFSHYQEAQSEALMNSFQGMVTKECSVIRNGTTIPNLDPENLVPGDVVTLISGNSVPADIRVMESSELQVDNSSLTGESEAQVRAPDLDVDKDGKPISQVMEAKNLIFYTTKVTNGDCTGIVIGTGDTTVMGKIAGLTTETKNEASPIKIEIDKFVHLISGVAIVLGITFFFVGVGFGTDFIKNVVFVIGIIVANVPEGLLATVTVSLALTANRMYHKQVLVKNLEAVETLGSTTVICSDKTGTLTQNRMTVTHCWYNQTIYNTPAAKNVPDLQALLRDTTGNYDPADPTFSKLLMVASLCNNSAFIETKEIDVKKDIHNSTFNVLSPKVDSSGDASEKGLLKFVQCLTDQQTYRDARPKMHEIKFNSTNKWQLSIHETEDKKSHTLVLKGAPERVLKRCKYMLLNGEKVKMTKELEESYVTNQMTIAGMGERVLGFAYSDLDPTEFPIGFKFDKEKGEYQDEDGNGTVVNRNYPADDLVFAGLISLIDPPREGVPEAVEKCKAASVKVYMVTGDHPVTAKAIARQVGIIDEHVDAAGKAVVITGDDIRGWQELIPEGAESSTASLAKWDEALDYEQIVFARVSPTQKLLIVENNRRRGQVVAVTGDGVNDAPALKKGDIGIAMGIAGTDVTKDAADMVLMDDNFASIVNGVEEGRLIFDNLKKSICYTLTSNIPEIGPFLCYITLQIPAPLSTVLILCVDLGTDMVPAISMAYEEKESDIMQRPPRNSATDRLVNTKLIVFAYLQIGIMQALAGFFTYMVVLNDYGYPPWILLKMGLPWTDYSVICTYDSAGKAKECGFGCKDPSWLDDEDEYCGGGCKIPFAGSADPFVEFTSDGFRGFHGSTMNTCGRSCDWFNNIAPTEYADHLISPEEVTMFQQYCSLGNFGFSKAVDGAPGKFENVRKNVLDDSKAPKGGFYWWDGRPQYYPNVGYQANALYYAQTSYFISIIVVQWADLLIAKTRKLSLFEQGMSNGFMNFGLCFETVLGMVLLYVPILNQVFGTRPLLPLHWFPGVPWSILIFLYDESRKFLMRQDKDGWIERFTYW